MKHGLFITFEGGEGSGKSTQTLALAGRLKEEGYDPVVTREPGGTRIGEEIRAITHSRENVDLDPVAEAYLMAASRAQHVREVIGPALAAGNIVISDRYLDSSIAYQGYGRRLGPDVVLRLNALAVNGAVPDLTILLFMDVQSGLRRRSNDTKIDRLDVQEEDFYLRVHGGYLALAKKYHERYVVVDATKDMEAVASIIWGVVRKRLEPPDAKKNA
ncbi:dTMP kinase [Patescibacteria group bacterium]|nr:dTMP kinase [Patescibacteria group bacterium]